MTIWLSRPCSTSPGGCVDTSSAGRSRAARTPARRHSQPSSSARVGNRNDEAVPDIRAHPSTSIASCPAPRSCWPERYWYAGPTNSRDALAVDRRPPGCWRQPILASSSLRSISCSREICWPIDSTDSWLFPRAAFASCASARNPVRPDAWRPIHAWVAGGLTVLERCHASYPIIHPIDGTYLDVGHEP
jgi:hypothetical protein